LKSHVSTHLRCQLPAGQLLFHPVKYEKKGSLHNPKELLITMFPLLPVVQSFDAVAQSTLALDTSVASAGPANPDRPIPKHINNQTH